MKTLLENIGLCAFLKTTGGKGLHVVLPIEPTVPWEHAKGFTKAVAELLERTFPDRFTSKLLKVSRHGRIFIDYLRNARGATAIAAYSTRAKPGAPVSMPLAWGELSPTVTSASREQARPLEIDVVAKPTEPPLPPNWKPGGYLERLPKDPWGNAYQYLNPGLRGEIEKQVAETELGIANVEDRQRHVVDRRIAGRGRGDRAT